MRQLSRHDAGFLYADTVHANANVTFVQIYDPSTAPGGAVRFKSILAHIQGRLHQSPIFRSKLLRVPFELDEPYWVEDEYFDLEYHVRHIALPKPGDWRQFCIQASRIHARALDLNRPLWEIYVIEGLDSITDLPPGSFALLTKIHHAAIDVESRNEFIELLHDRSPRPPKAQPPQPWFPESAPGPLALLSRAALHRAFSPLKWMEPLTRTLPKALTFARDVLHPEHHLSATRFHAVVSPHRVFDTRRFLVAEFEAIRALVPGATVDDAVLAVCAGGLRSYLARQAELPEADLTAQVPEQAPGATQGTRRIQLGTSIADPVQRLAWIHAQTAAPAPTAGTAAARNLAPPCCTVTAVSSPDAAVYLHGAHMTYFSAILPISDGMGLVFAVSRYDERIVISPTSCRELVPDPEVFTQGVRDCFQDLLALARQDPSLAASAGAAAAAAAASAPPKPKPTPKPARTARSQPAAPPAAPTGAQKTVRSAGARASAAGTPAPSARQARSAAKPPAAAPGGRRRSTAPSD
jgi:WS/DGAT/MGAT family acyltransferase